MTENNAAQPGQDPLTDQFVNAVIRQHGYDSPEAVIARLWQWIGLNGSENGVTLLMYEAHKALSKMRAEGVQAGDERETFNEWDRLFTVYCGAEPGAEAGKAAGILMAFTRAALASAPVAGEACAWFTEDHLTDKSATTWDRTVAERWRAKGWPVRPLVYGGAAPQASEAVPLSQYGYQVLFNAIGEAVKAHGKDYVEISVQAFREALKTQADKDGGDCAKGGGEVGVDSLESRASAYGTVVLPPLPTPPEHKGHAMYAGSQMMAYARAAVLADRQQRAALSPTPSVVKQSLTATQTGEKGESDAG